MCNNCKVLDDSFNLWSFLLSIMSCGPDPVSMGWKWEEGGKRQSANLRPCVSNLPVKILTLPPVLV